MSRCVLVLLASFRSRQLGVRMNSAAVEIDGSVMEGVSTLTLISGEARTAVVLMCMLVC